MDINIKMLMHLQNVLLTCENFQTVCALCVVNLCLIELVLAKGSLMLTMSMLAVTDPEILKGRGGVRQYIRLIII